MTISSVCVSDQFDSNPRFVCLGLKTFEGISFCINFDEIYPNGSIVLEQVFVLGSNYLW